jgi:hypothetical protein
MKSERPFLIGPGRRKKAAIKNLYGQAANLF